MAVPTRWILNSFAVLSFAVISSCQTTSSTNSAASSAPGITINPDTHSVVEVVKNLKVVTIPDPPFIMTEPNKKGNWRGMAIDILKQAVKGVGFDDVEVIISKDLLFGGQEVAGYWTGMIGNLVNGTADIAVGALTVTANRATAIHFTQPFMQAGFRVLYKIPDSWRPGEAMVTMLRPFTPGLWVLLILMFVVTSLALYLIGRYSPYEDVAFVGKTATYEGLNVPNTFLYIFSSFVWQGYTAAPKSISGRVLTGVWWVFALFTVAAYIAGLTVILFRVNPEIRTLPFATMDEMSRQNKVGIMVVQNGSAHRYLASSKAELETRIYGKIIADQEELLVESTQAGIDKVMESNGAYGLLMEGPSAEYLQTQPPCNKMAIGEPLGHNVFAFACRNNSDVCNKMDVEIIKMKEDGRMQELKDKWFHKGCMKNKPENYIFQGLPFFDTFGGDPDAIMPLTITITRFSSAFIVLTIGIIIAGVCLGVEIFYARRRGTAVPRKLERSGPDDDMERIHNEYRDDIRT